MNLPTRRALLFTVAVLAATMGGARGAESALARPLQELYDALESAMRAGNQTPFPQRFDALAPVIDRVFDLETVLKVSVGMRWDSMDASQRARLLRVYRRFTVATYVANFDRYDGERFQILPGVRESGTDRIIGTEVIAGNERTRLDYVMRESKGVWRAVDVLVEGSISRVAVQRSDFRKTLATGETDGLIASLNRKIADLSNGALRS
jgi:phospholipid transport system substrate-binding protein